MNQPLLHDPHPGPAVRPFSPLMAFLARLHAYIGLFVGPFLLVSALTGVAYVLTPQLESHLYREQLQARAQGEAQPLLRQIEAARGFLGEHGGEVPAVTAVRPAPVPGRTSRVLFARPQGRDGESLSVFVDPASLAVHGALVSYGTSGTLPFRGAIDYFHRDLGLGEIGRHYSELAASWLWVGVVSGLGLWLYQRRRNRQAGSPAKRWHRRIGLVVALGVLFFSATGMTWSKWAGELRLDQLRTELGWVTPSLATALDGNAAAPAAGGHEDHAGHAGQSGQSGHVGPAGHSGHAAGSVAAGAAAAVMAAGADADPATRYDPVLATARAAGIDGAGVEIRPPKNAGHAWTVREIDRNWPSQADSVAVDPRSMSVVSRADFETFPLIAKLIRWGIDAHMGILFGWPNQLLVALLALGLAVLIVLGYVMWWRRTKLVPATAGTTLVGAWLRMGAGGKLLALLLLAFFGWWLPVLGVSLLLFLVPDLLRFLWLRQREPGLIA